MSLFSSKQWWHTRLGSGEEFDQGSICVANIDNDPVGTGAMVSLLQWGFWLTYSIAGCCSRLFPVEGLDCWILQQT